MTCKDCIHSGLCYKENDYYNFPDRCGDFTPTVELTEEQAIDKLHETGWMQRHDKEMTERPTGEWIRWNFKTFGALGDWEYKCSKCEKVYDGEYNFCPNCGAKMKGGEGK